MAKLSMLAGSTSQSVNVFIQASNVSTGAGLTGLVFNTASLVAYYTFAGANTTAAVISLQTLAAVNSAWASGGFKEIDATNMPGLYRLDIPDAALAASKGRSVALMLKGAANMAPCLLEIELTAVDNQSATNGLGTLNANVLQWNSTNVSAPATAGIPDVNVKNIDNDAASASGTVTFPNATLASTTGAVGSVTGAVGSVTGLTAANLDVAVSTRLAASSYTAPSNASIASIKTKTDSLNFTVAGQVDANIQSVNDTAVQGDGQLGTEWGPV